MYSSWIMCKLSIRLPRKIDGSVPLDVSFLNFRSWSIRSKTSLKQSGYVINTLPQSHHSSTFRDCAPLPKTCGSNRTPDLRYKTSWVSHRRACGTGNGNE